MKSRRLTDDGAPGWLARALLNTHLPGLGGPLPGYVEAAARFKAQSFLIDGEVVIARDDGMLDFHPLRSQRRGASPSTRSSMTATTCATCLIDRKRRLAKL